MVKLISSFYALATASDFLCCRVPAVQLGGIVSLLDIERELTFAAAIQICRERDGKAGVSREPDRKSC